MATEEAAQEAGVPHTASNRNNGGGLVSLIVPVYNTERYLRRSLDSILRQSHARFEVIAVDDGSNDGSPGILQDYAARDHRLRVLTQGNLGPGATRNRGMAEARGDWICFVDSDDYMHPRCVERLLEAVLACDADLALCCAVCFDEETGNPVDQAFASLEFPVSFDERGFDVARCLRRKDLVGINLAPWAKIVRADIARAARFPENVRSFEDNPFVYGAVLRARRIAYLREQLYYYRRHPESTMGRIRTGGDLPFKVFEDFREVRRLCLEIFEHDSELAALYARASSDMLRQLYVKLPRELRREYMKEVGEPLAGHPGVRRAAVFLANFAPYGVVKLARRLLARAKL